ncbi:GGDEF domain-containing protein [Actinospongicola halichondriae]|uniref:GGDEF domain-containing protein n=1 Tax=Actinospongicola halichondriae TaxID=3236844 RepID=UPI003D45E18E
MTGTPSVHDTNTASWPRALLAASPDGYVALDRNGSVRYANPAAADLLGWSLEQLAVRAFATMFHPDDEESARETIEGLVAERAGLTRARLLARAEHGVVRVLDVVLRDLRHSEAIEGFVVTIRDSTAQVQRERDLSHQLAHDTLTGAMSRGEFLERVEAALTDRRRRRPIGVLFVDVDYFKLVNDQFGHHVGDRSLVSVCEIIQGAVRDGDIVARFGGDEFVALLYDVQGSADLGDVAERVVESVRLRGQVDDEVLAVTVSVGGALSAEDGVAGLLHRADHALLDAKNGGRDQVVLDG